jgi:hypothetical protein
VRYPGASPRTPALVGSEFIQNWNDLTLGDLFERTRISMPQQKPGSLPRSVVADIVAFVLQSGGYSAGLSELPSNYADLSAIAVRWERR